MEFFTRSPYQGNVKPIMQHVQGNVLKEWRIDKEKDRIVCDAAQLESRAVGPRAGTFFLGGMEVTRDELGDYLLEANERNASKPKSDRLPEIQRKIANARDRHAEAIKEAVRLKQAGVKLPDEPIERPKRYMLVPKAVGMIIPSGEMIIQEIHR